MKMCSCRPVSPWYVARHRFYSSPLLLHSNESAPPSARQGQDSRVGLPECGDVLLCSLIEFSTPSGSLRLSPAASEPRVCLSVNLSTAAGWRPVACVGVCAAGTRREQMDFRGGFLILCINAATTLQVVFHLPNLRSRLASHWCFCQNSCRLLLTLLGCW